MIDMASTTIRIYSDPAGLLDLAASDRHVWRRAWLPNAAALLVALATLRAAASLSGRPWTVMLGYAALAFVSIMIGLSMAVTTTRHPQFWMLFLGAPPVTLTALLAGLGTLWPGLWVLSGVLGVPLLLGVLLSSACAIWAYNRTSGQAREYTRQRQAGAPADLPALAFQGHARTFRCVAAAGLGLLAFAAQPLFWPAAPLDGAIVGLALIVCAAACTRIEASLLCWLGKPLVMRARGDAWRTTYAGRWALFAPTTSILPLLTSGQPAALIALFQDGCLGPRIRRACRHLTLAQAERLALTLSLQPGGAGAIHYLLPAIPALARAIALTYARLAEEAARPRDMRRWLAALTEHPGIARLSETELAPDLARALAAAEAALQCYTYDPVLDEATQRLRQLMPALSSAASRPAPACDVPERWPEALLERVVAHGRLLGAHQLRGSNPVEPI